MRDSPLPVSPVRHLWPHKPGRRPLLSRRRHGGLTSPPPPPLLVLSSYVTLWIGLSIGVILYNKWILAYSGFPYPVTLTVRKGRGEGAEGVATVAPPLQSRVPPPLT